MFGNHAAYLFNSVTGSVIGKYWNTSSVYNNRTDHSHERILRQRMLAQPTIIFTRTHALVLGITQREQSQLIQFPLYTDVCRAVSQSSPCLPVSLLRCVSRGTLASVVAEQLVIYISEKDVVKHLSIIMQLQLKALANVPPHWERTASLIWFSRRCISPRACVRESA